MGKRSTQKKRGIQRGVAKHKIRSKPLKQKEHQKKVLGIPESFYFAVGKNCFEFWFFCCRKLYLIPFTRTAQGDYVALEGSRKRIHYLVWFIKFLVLLHKTWGLAAVLLFEELKTETFIILSLFMVYFVSFCISFVVLARPKETMDLLNCWPLVLSCLKELDLEASSPFDDISEVLMLVTVMIVTQAIALAAALLSLAFDTLPVCYYPTLYKLGLIPEGVLTRFGWQLIFAPLEYATNIHPMLSAPFSGGIFIILVGVFKIFSNGMR